MKCRCRQLERESLLSVHHREQELAANQAEAQPGAGFVVGDNLVSPTESGSDLVVIGGLQYTLE